MSEKLVHVRSYQRDDGTKVKEHYRGGGTSDESSSMLLTGGISEEVYLPADLESNSVELNSMGEAAVEVLKYLGEISTRLSEDGIKLVTALNSARESFDEEGVEQLSNRMYELVNQLYQSHSESLKAEEATLGKLSETKDQREYKQLYDTYVYQRNLNNAAKTLINHIAYSNEHKNYEELTNSLEEYNSLHRESSERIQEMFPTPMEPTYLNFKEHPLPQAQRKLSEMASSLKKQIGQNCEHAIRTVFHKHPLTEKNLIMGGMSLKIENAYDAFALLIASAYDFQLSGDYIAQNGYLLDSVSDLSPQFRSIVSKKLKQQIGRGDSKGLILRPDSTLSKEIAQSPEIKEFIKENMNSLLAGEVVSGSTCFASNDNLALSLGNADILNTYINNNGDIVAIVFDTYDFNQDDPRWKVEWAYNVQKHGLLTNFYTLNIIVIPKEEWMI